MTFGYESMKPWNTIDRDKIHMLRELLYVERVVRTDL